MSGIGVNIQAVITADSVTISNNSGTTYCVALVGGSINANLVTINNNICSSVTGTGVNIGIAITANLVTVNNNSGNTYGVYIGGAINANSVIVNNNTSSATNASSVVIDVALTVTSITMSNNTSSGASAINIFIKANITADSITMSNNAANASGGFGVFIQNTVTINVRELSFKYNIGLQEGVRNRGTIKTTIFELIQNCTSLVQNFNNLGTIVRLNGAGDPSLVLIDNVSCTNTGNALPPIGVH